MKASAFEYRFRLPIQAFIYLLGFLAPWLYIPGVATSRAIDEPAWLGLSTFFFRQGWLTYSAAVIVLLVLALVFTALGAWFRTWGAAYTTSANIFSSDGPYRRTRNPLFLGTLLHTFGISLLMPPTGALFAVVLLWIFQIRLAIAKEAILTTRFGQFYLTYKAAVQRFLPSPTAWRPKEFTKPSWLTAVLAELYFVLTFFVLAIFGWGFDKTTIRRGLLISLGISLIAQAFLPRIQTPAVTPEAPLTL